MEQRCPAKLLVAPWAGEPGRQLGPHLRSEPNGEPPVREGCVKHGLVDEGVRTLQVRPLDGADGWLLGPVDVIIQPAR